MEKVMVYVKKDFKNQYEKCKNPIIRWFQNSKDINYEIVSIDQLKEETILHVLKTSENNLDDFIMIRTKKNTKEKEIIDSLPLKKAIKYLVQHPYLIKPVIAIANKEYQGEKYTELAYGENELCKFKKSTYKKKRSTPKMVCYNSHVSY